ncbi:MAG: LCP family protein [Lachnospiraceae bacterium]|jgi:LCP family protein required for cell wall assembly|nr:LCP family protein [Lachnospiraceae bacterium]
MGKRQVDKKSAAFKKYRRRRTLFIVEVFLLVLVCGGAFVYVQLDKKLNSIQIQQLDSSKVTINQAAETDEVIKGYTNIALFGVDSREGNIDQTNTDTIIIASINNDTKVVRLVSVYRDTYLDIGHDRYAKANAAYANGGAERAITMLNTNLDLDIKSFVTVDFNALVDIIDLLGGIEITVTEEECVHLNNYCVETSKVTGKEYENLPGEGTYLVNGVQGVSYARIRFTAGNDFKRTARQREVVAKIVDKAKKADIGTLNEIMDKVFPMIKTNLSKSEILSMGMNMLSYELGETTGFPFTHSTNGDDEIPVTLETNVDQLHTFLFDNEDYEPSSDVKERSDYIIEKTGFTEDSAASSENYQGTGEELASNGKENSTEEESETEETQTSGYGD